MKAADKIIAKGKWLRIAALAMVMFYWPLILWSLLGMEVGIITMMLMIAVRMVLTKQSLQPGDEALEKKCTLCFRSNKTLRYKSSLERRNHCTESGTVCGRSATKWAS